MHSANGSSFAGGVAWGSWGREDEVGVSGEIAFEVVKGVVLDLGIGEMDDDKDDDKDDEAEPMSAGNPERIKCEENMVSMSRSERISSPPCRFFSVFQRGG